ncbi:MAG: dienelactone hydrolase family protein, partial [Pseudomonadota bacterium]|nr:dienelactone hydrolase family protein [Pseudomonadota bacterium]
MTHIIKIEAEDGHTLEAAVAGDPDTARGGVVVLQEIFGLNEHIRDLPRRFAEAGYYAVAPAMFDRAEPGVELDYNAAGKERGIALKNAVDADALFDVSAAIRAAAAAGPVSVVGFCWGGSLAWR